MRTSWKLLRSRMVLTVVLAATAGIAGRVEPCRAEGRGHQQSDAEKAASARVCSLLTTADLKAALRMDVNDGMGSANTRTGKATCGYSLGDGSGRMVSLSTITGDTARATFMQRRGEGKTAFGVGKEAVWLPDSSVLWVLATDGTVIELELSTAASAIRGDPKSVAMDLARKVLSRL